MKKVLSLIALVVVSTAALLAAGVDGKWTATQTFGDRSFESTMTFKAEGTKLTGTVSGRRGDNEIQDGKIEGDNISFTVKRQTQKGDFTSNYKGTVNGDEIEFTISMGDRESKLTAKRVK
ncbi:MAG: hypothetical protein ABI972_16380 [Acidobacteriota bacterium]